MKEMKIIQGVYTYNDGDILFNFATDLTAVNKQSLVNTVVELVVDDKHYNSVLKDLMFDFCLIDALTDIDTQKFWKSETFFNDVEAFLSETNIIDIIKANSEPSLITSLSNAVDLSIEYTTGIHKNPLSEALANLVNTLNQKVNEVDLDSMMGMATKFASMTEDLNVDNIVKAYVESNTHKENLKEIAEAKLEKVKDNLKAEAESKED